MPNKAIELTALRAAAHSQRSAQMTTVGVELPERVLVPSGVESQP